MLALAGIAPASAHDTTTGTTGPAPVAAAREAAGTAQDPAAKNPLNLVETTDPVEVLAARITAAEKKIKTARAELRAANQELREVTARLQRTQAAHAAAVLEQARATVRLTKVGYATGTTRDTLQTLARDSYVNGAAQPPEWVPLLTDNTDQLTSRTALAKAEERAVAATNDTRAAYAAQSRRSTSLAEQAQAAATRLETLQTRARDDAARARMLRATAAEKLAELTRRKKTLEADYARAAVVIDADESAAAQRAAAQTDVHTATQTTRASLSLAARKVLARPLTALTRPATGPVTSPYGMRFHPVLHYTKLHTGTDFSFSRGDGFVYAAARGVVLATVWNSAYGNLTVIGVGTQDGKLVETWYAHQAEFFVRPGQVVKAGQRIGRIGSTGYSTGPHLHFEVRLDRVPVDPMPLLGKP